MSQHFKRRLRAIPIAAAAIGLLVAGTAVAAYVPGAVGMPTHISGALIASTSAATTAIGAATTNAATSAATPAAGAPAIESRVTRLRRPQPSSFTEDGERFRRGERLDPALLPLPARVLKSSSKGYVQVESAAGPVWLDSMDVVLDPPPALKAACVKSVSTRSDLRVAGVSGAGEDC